MAKAMGCNTIAAYIFRNYQNQGPVLCRIKPTGHKSGKHTVTESHDFGLVCLYGVYIVSVRRDGGKWTVNLPKSAVKDPVLEILMEGMGHINFAQYMIDRKGITDRVTLNGMTLMNWDMFPLPMQAADVTQKTALSVNGTDDRPGELFTGKFQLAETGDTYFDMHAYRKGMLYVNGHLLGRYWNKVPKWHLYCPAVFLKKGGTISRYLISSRKCRRESVVKSIWNKTIQTKNKYILCQFPEEIC